MALAAPQQNLISDVGIVCRTLLDIQGSIEQINILYNGSPDWDTLITDEEINGVPSFVEIGLTAADVADAIFQINAVRTLVTTGNLPAVVLLSQTA